MYKNYLKYSVILLTIALSTSSIAAQAEQDDKVQASSFVSGNLGKMINHSNFGKPKRKG